MADEPLDLSGIEAAVDRLRRLLDERLLKPRVELEPYARKTLKTLNPSALLLAIPGLAGRFKPIPHQSVAYDLSAPDPTVHCPCGTLPVIELTTLRKCPGCERYYIATPLRVYVAYGEMEPPG